MPSNLYATSFEMMDRLGISQDDSREGIFLDVLEAASRWIDRITGRRFYAASETRYFTLCYPHYGGTQLDVGDILSVTTLETDNNGDGVFETTWTTGTDYYLSPRNAPLDAAPYTLIKRTSLTGRFYFPAYEEAIRVTGSFGYSTLANRPVNIRELCLMVASQLAGPQLVTSSQTTSGTVLIPGVKRYQIGQELEVEMASASDQQIMATLPTAGVNIVNLYKRQSLVV